MHNDCLQRFVHESIYCSWIRSLYHLSGAKVPDDIAKDIMCRDQWGVDARDKFIHDRLEGKAERPEDRDIHKAITQCKLWL